MKKKTIFTSGMVWTLKNGERIPVKDFPFEVTCDKKIYFTAADGSCKFIDLEYLADFLLANQEADTGIAAFTWAETSIADITANGGLDITPNTDIVKIVFDLDATPVKTYNMGDTGFADIASGTTDYQYTGLTASTAYTFGVTLTDVEGATLRQTYNSTTTA